MRSTSDEHGTLAEAYSITESLVAIGKQRMDDALSLDDATRSAEARGEQAALRAAELDPAALMELSDNLRHCMKYRFEIADDSFDIEEATHVAIAFVAWSNGFGIMGMQLAIAMQMVECSLDHVLTRVRSAPLAQQSRGLVAFVQRNAGSVAHYAAWCAAQSQRLQQF